MRRRRADRCLLKARQALAARRVDEARRACADAREMDPWLPELAAIEEAIAALPARRRYAGLTTAAACLTALALAAILARHAWTGPPAQPHEHAVAPADIVLIAPAGNGSPVSPPVEPAPAQPDPEPPAVPSAAVAEPQLLEPVAAATSSDPLPLDPPATPDLAPLGALPAPAFETPIPPSPPLPEPSESAVLTPSGAAGPAAESELRVETSAIRRTLARYETAYSDLDAAAARTVWPTVDQRALARAFDGLAAQRISLDDCNVIVTGATALAACSGAATWTAKVGGGRHSQARRWTFELTKGAGGWEIVRAETREAYHP